jgi:hypothetical protein
MGSKATERKAVFSFAVLFLGALIVLAVTIPNPSGWEYIVFKVILALGAAGFAAYLPGSLGINVNTWVRGGGALGVLVLVYLYNPAAPIPPDQPKPPSQEEKRWIRNLQLNIEVSGSRYGDSSGRRGVPRSPFLIALEEYEFNAEDRELNDLRNTIKQEIDEAPDLGNGYVSMSDSLASDIRELVYMVQDKAAKAGVSAVKSRSP